MVKSTLEFIMLMCVHLSAQDRHQGARWGEPGGGAREGDVRWCVLVQIAGQRTPVLSGCLPNWLVGGATRFDP